jgi:hypothetical protein
LRRRRANARRPIVRNATSTQEQEETPMTDTDTRSWAKGADVKEGDLLEADDGFPCLSEGDRRRVCKHASGDLIIECGDGGHWLDTQIDEEDQVYIGLYKVEE